MKYNRTRCVLALAVSLSLLAMAYLPIPAHAGDYGSMKLQPKQAEIGDRISITGHDLHRRSGIYIYFSSNHARLGDEINDEVTAYEQVALASSDKDGDFEASFVVPERLTDGVELEDVHGGQYYVYATHHDSDGIAAVADFMVTAIELDTTEGTTGTQVEIRGGGFDEEEDIVLRYDGAQIYPVSGEEATDKYGEFVCTIIIPQSVMGRHTITFEDESRNRVSTEFTVRPDITIVPTSSTPNTEVTVTGTGFGSRSNITIYFGNNELAGAITSEQGSFETTLSVALTPNFYEVKAVDSDGNSGTSKFNVVPNMSLSQTTGNVGTEITASGTDFLPDMMITVKYDAIEVARVKANSNGAFATTFTIPVSQYGEHTVTAGDGTSTATSAFTMESIPPPTPTPLLPEEMGAAKPLAHFDWKDVPDPSGLTYTLQIARDANFLLLLLTKEGLTDSEYTLAAAEELQATTKEAPYYWRVKAVDRASNESDWSRPASFYAGFSRSGIPAWVLYAWVGLGILLIGFFALWLGRKIARKH